MDGVPQENVLESRLTSTLALLKLSFVNLQGRDILNYMNPVTKSVRSQCIM